MTEDTEKEATKLDQILDSLDMLFARVTDIGLAQQHMKAQLDLNTQAIGRQTSDQQTMARQLEETGPAVARLTLQQMEKEDASSSTKGTSYSDFTKSSSSGLSKHSKEAQKNPFAKDVSKHKCLQIWTEQFS